MKIFGTRSKDIIHDHIEMFNIRKTDSAISKHKCKFFNSILSSTNVLCLICREFAEDQN